MATGGATGDSEGVGEWVAVPRALEKGHARGTAAKRMWDKEMRSKVVPLTDVRCHSKCMTVALGITNQRGLSYIHDERSPTAKSSVARCC